MSARNNSSPEGSSPSLDDFSELEGLINAQFLEALAANKENARYRFFTITERQDAQHSLGVFCIADSIEPLRKQRSEELKLLVPLERPGITNMISVLGRTADAHYFYLGYKPPRGKPRELRVDEDTFQSRFLRKPYEAPVRDFAIKALTYRVVPLRERGRGLTG